MTTDQRQVGVMQYEGELMRSDRELSLKAKLATILLFASWLYAFSPQLQRLYEAWQWPTERHVMLVLLAEIGLLVRNLPTLYRLKPNSSQFGLLLLFLSCAFWIYAEIQEYSLIALTVVVLLVPIQVLVCNGLNIFLALRFQLFLLLFVIPVGVFVTPFMQSMMLDSTYATLAFLRPVVLQSEVFDLVTRGELKSSFFFPAMEWAMGILALSFLATYLAAVAFIHRVLIFTSFILLPVVAQVFLAIFVLVFFSTEMPLAAVNVKVANWLGFIFGLGISGYITWFLVNKFPLSSESRLGWHQHVNFKHFRWFKPTVVATCVLLSTPWLADNLINNPWRSQGIVIYQSGDVPNWSGPYLPVDPTWQPSVTGSTASLHALYQQQGLGIELFAAYYDNSQKDVSIYDSEVEVYRPKVWNVTAKRTRTIELNEDAAINVTEEIVEAGEKTRIIWHWYFMGELQTPSLSFLLVLERLRTVSEFAAESGMIAISTEVADNLDDSRALLNAFLMQLYPKINRLMHPPRSLN